MKWLVLIEVCWSVALVVLGWVAGYRFGHSAGITEGYGQCMLERRRRKSDLFARMYGGPLPDSSSSIAGGGFEIGERPDRRSK